PMYLLKEIQARRATERRLHPSDAQPVTVSPLAAENEDEVLAFLAERSIHTFGMAGFIRDNGLVSPHNRGTFYASRDEEGRLDGVGLIGRFILFETRSEASINAFAGVAQKYPTVHLLLGEKAPVQRFWSYYADGGQPPRLICRELL